MASSITNELPVRSILRHATLIAILLLGSWLLLSSWQSFDQIGLNRGRGYPRYASRIEISFWYSFLPFQAGVLIASATALLKYNPRNALRILAVIVWVEFLNNIGVLLLLAMSGAFIP
jgi:hypothetical protein